MDKNNKKYAWKLIAVLLVGSGLMIGTAVYQEAKAQTGLVLLPTVLDFINDNIRGKRARQAAKDAALRAVQIERERAEAERTNEVVLTAATLVNEWNRAPEQTLRYDVGLRYNRYLDGLCARTDAIIKLSYDLSRPQIAMNMSELSTRFSTHCIKAVSSVSDPRPDLQSSAPGSEAEANPEIERLENELAERNQQLENARSAAQAANAAAEMYKELIDEIAAAECVSAHSKDKRVCQIADQHPETGEERVDIRLPEIVWRNLTGS